MYYKVTAFDFPGFGASSPLDEAYSVGDYSVWLEKFMDKAGLNRPHIIAHSFGARVALKFLSAHPERCEKLVITGGAGIVKPRSKQYLRRVKRYRRVKRLFPKFAEKHFGSKEYRTLSPLMKESYKKIVNEDLKECAKQIRCPTLLLYGTEDTVTPYAEEGRTFNSIIEGSRLEAMQGSHFCFCEHSGEFNKIIYKFLSEK